MNRITIDKIDFSLDYEGYFWYSNASKPVLLNSEKISKDIFKPLPFILEGNLYCKEKELSINIKNIDGEYQIFQAYLSNLPKNQVTEQCFLTHDLDGIEKIKLLQFWKESEPDELLAGMTTLHPSWQAFAGFIKK